MSSNNNIIKFGKFKGLSIQEIGDIKPSYLLFLFKQHWIDADIKREIENVLFEKPIWFGKYRGETINEIKLHNQAYVDWLLI